MGDGRAFADMDEVELAYQLGQVEVHTEIKLLAETWYNDKEERLPAPETRLIDTTVGRVIFNRILPEQVQFVNRKLDKGGVKDLIAEVYELCGQEITTDVADRVKSLGFEFAMRSGTTLAVADISIPPERKEIIEESLKAVELVQRLRKLDLKKHPSVSETLDWARALLTLNARNLDQKTLENTMTVLLKHEHDVQRAQRILGEFNVNDEGEGNDEGRGASPMPRNRLPPTRK